MLPSASLSGTEKVSEFADWINERPTPTYKWLTAHPVWNSAEQFTEQNPHLTIQIVLVKLSVKCLKHNHTRHTSTANTLLYYMESGGCLDLSCVSGHYSRGSGFSGDLQIREKNRILMRNSNKILFYVYYMLGIVISPLPGLTHNSLQYILVLFPFYRWRNSPAEGNLPKVTRLVRTPARAIREYKDDNHYPIHLVPTCVWLWAQCFQHLMQISQVWRMKTRLSFCKWGKWPRGAEACRSTQVNVWQQCRTGAQVLLAVWI